MIVPTTGNSEFDLGVVGRGFDSHNGQNAVGLARRRADGAIVGNPIITQVVDGRFSFLWPHALVANTEYELVYYVDDSLECTDAGADVWLVAIGPVLHNTVVEVVHDDSLANQAACTAFALYALAFTGSGYTQHNGQSMVVAVVRADDAHLAAGPERTTIINGAIYVELAAALQPGFRYEVHYYADHNDNGACDPAPVDHEWRVPFGPVDGDWRVNHSASSDYSNVCATFAGD